MFKFLAIVTSIGALIVSGPATAAQVTHVARNAEATLQLIHDSGRDNDKDRGRDNNRREQSSKPKKNHKPPMNCSAFKSALLKKHCEHQNDDDDDDDGDGGNLPACEEGDDDCPVSA